MFSLKQFIIFFIIYLNNVNYIILELYLSLLLLKFVLILLF